MRRAGSRLWLAARVAGRYEEIATIQWADRVVVNSLHAVAAAVAVPGQQVQQV
jgi:hypothetical protein